MAFDELNRYSPTHKVWDHVGNIIPDIEHSEGERPAHEFHPAAWLPVQFYDKHYENWMVVMPGKCLALDPDGNLMSGEYGLTGASVVYSASDVGAGTIDVATGLPVTTAKTVVLSNLSGTLAGTAATAGTGGVTSGFMGRAGVDFVDGTQKYFVGVAPYAYLQWAGGDGFNPSQYQQHNYNMQHQVAVLCDYVIKLPLIPAQAASEGVEVAVAVLNLVFGTADTHTRVQAQANAEGRYNPTTGTVPVSLTAPVIALALDNENVAKNTARTTITLQSTSASDDLSSILVTEKGSVSAVTQAGDFFVDYLVGVIFIYSADGATIPPVITGAGGTVSITYYHTNAAPAVVSTFASVLAEGIVPGDFLKVGADSNLVVAAPATDNICDIVGQVLALDNNFPKDSLERVRTAYSPAIGTNPAGSMANAVAGGPATNLGQMDQMPGSATGGYPDLLHYAGGADTLVIVNLISR